ncbi:MAG: vWA domain-containing protein [Bacillota bacterium]
MPNFLNPWLAAAAAAVVVPSLLLLYFLKLRRREVDVSSTLLWKKAIQDLQVNAPFQRLRRNLLLLLQMLLLILLLLAFARPVMNYTPGMGKVAVILIDRSASMSAADLKGKTRLEEAKRQAKEMLDSMDKDGSAMVIAFDDTAEIIRSFTTDRALLRQAIDSIQSTDRRSKLKLAFQLAEAKAASFNPEQRGPLGPKPEIWLYSDGRVLDADELTLRFADLKYNQTGTKDAENVAIVALSAKRNYERPAEVQAFVRLANFGPEPRTAVVQLSVDGQVIPSGIKRGLLLFPERWTPAEREKAEKEQKLVAQNAAEFRLDLLKGAVIRVEIKEQGNDALAADDVAQLILPPPRSLNVLLVTKNGNWWLERFLESANLKNPGTITPAAYEEKMANPQAVAAEYDVILFDRYQPKALPPAGNFIFNGTVPPKSKLTAVMQNDVPMTIQDNAVLDWERNHPLLRHMNLKFLATESLKLQVPPDAQTLIEGDKGPLVALQRDSRSTHLVFAFDVGDSTWPLAASFPIFMDNALQYLALGTEMDVRQSYQPGASPKIPRYNLQQAGANLKQIKLQGPPAFGTATVPVPPTGDFALPSLDRVGVYTLTPPIPQFETLAVNLLDDSESNLLPIPQPPGGTGEVLAATGGKSRMELWRWIIAFGAIPLCLLEWWIYTRRVHP